MTFVGVADMSAGLIIVFKHMLICLGFFFTMHPDLVLFTSLPWKADLSSCGMPSPSL